MNILALIAAHFLVTLSPHPGVNGGPVRVTIEAHDGNTARRLAQAQYGRSYRVTDVRRINRR